MSLSSLHLDAFRQVARLLNFSRAAAELHITQSALTQRIQNFEEELGLTLFLRQARGVALTEAGERLLRYCQARTMLEDELLGDLNGDGDGLGGPLRLAGFSTVIRSVALTALAPLLRANPAVTPHFFVTETRCLADFLTRGEADFILSDHAPERAGIEGALLGHEVYVLAASRDHDPGDASVYLDHDPEDLTTMRFLSAQDHNDAIRPPPRRAYLDEIYGVIDGVALGLGRAVIPRHLALGDSRLQIIEGLKPLRSPVYLAYFKQPFYSRLQQAVVAELTNRVPALLP